MNPFLKMAWFRFSPHSIDHFLSSHDDSSGSREYCLYIYEYSRGSRVHHRGSRDGSPSSGDNSPGSRDQSLRSRNHCLGSRGLSFGSRDQTETGY